MTRSGKTRGAVTGDFCTIDDGAPPFAAKALAICSRLLIRCARAFEIEEFSRALSPSVRIPDGFGQHRIKLTLGEFHRLPCRLSR
jgi:hypothetical protein